jgi:hypothetical protein
VSRRAQGEGVSSRNTFGNQQRGLVNGPHRAGMFAAWREASGSHICVVTVGSNRTTADRDVNATGRWRDVHDLVR